MPEQSVSTAFVSVKQFAKLSGLTESAIRRLIADKVFPVLRIGRNLKINPCIALEAINAYMECDS